MTSALCDSSSSVYQQLQRTREEFWKSLAHLSEEERKQIWVQAASGSNNVYDVSHDSLAYQVPRSMLSTSNLTQLPTPDYGLMDRTYSAPMMGRSTSATGSNTNVMHRSTSAWQSMAQETTNDYVLFSDAPLRKQQALQPITEFSPSNEDMTEWNPSDYITRCIEPASSPSLPFHPQQMQLTPNLQQWSSSSESSTAPSTPSTALTTPLTHSSSSMSRQSSYNSHFIDDTSMLRIQSDSSCMLSIPEDGSISFDSFNVDPKAINVTVDGSSFPIFTGSTSEAFFSPAQSVFPSAQALAPFENDTSYLAEDMRRSTSTTSSEGNLSDASAPSSTCSRQTRREREINAQAAARKIAPKAIESNDETESPPSNAQMAEIKSQDGSSKTVGVLTKTPYVRPQHPKIMCQFCQERPEGFRGTHELDRHIARAHAPSRKGYICVDSSPGKKFLANCKHCRNKKVYGAYYNAAAHLRRAHFHPRKRGRKGKNDEKRGGIGGGDHPAMEHLKMHWIKEVDVDNKMPSSPDSACDDAADNSFESTFDIDPSYPTQQPMPASINTQLSIDTNQYGDYGMSVNATEPVMYDTNNFAYDNIAPANDMSSFQFDAYM